MMGMVVGVEVIVTKAVDVVLDEITMVDVALDDGITMMLHIVVDEVITMDVVIVTKAVDVVLDEITKVDVALDDGITMMLHIVVDEVLTMDVVEDEIITMEVKVDKIITVLLGIVYLEGEMEEAESPITGIDHHP
jgi:hypothetical protein